MDMRTHVANNDSPLVLREARVDNFEHRGAFKPAGFWYEVDGDWRRWCSSQDFRTDRPAHLHQVSLNDCNVLFVNILGKLDQFHREYSTIPVGDGVLSGIFRIDWEKVAKTYDGVEIAPYQWGRRLDFNFMWYYGWDCASGVIWRPKNAMVTYLGQVRWGSSNEENPLVGSRLHQTAHHKDCTSSIRMRGRRYGFKPYFNKEVDAVVAANRGGSHRVSKETVPGGVGYRDYQMRSGKERT